MNFYIECTDSFQRMQYIRKLLFSDLDKPTVQHVLRQLRKLPWEECEKYLVKCFLKVHKGKYSHIHMIALLTTRLSRYCRYPEDRVSRIQALIQDKEQCMHPHAAM
jgi:hypothetical protein